MTHQEHGNGGVLERPRAVKERILEWPGYTPSLTDGEQREKDRQPRRWGDTVSYDDVTRERHFARLQVGLPQARLVGFGAELRSARLLFCISVLS